MHLRCGKKSASNRNNQEWDRLKFVPLLWQANVFPDHLKSPSVINDDERIPAADRAARNSFGLHLLCEHDVKQPHRAACIAVPLVQGIRRIGVFRSLPDDDEKPVTVQLVIEAADALLIAGGF